MKARVLKEFRDRDDFSKVYRAGDVVDFEASRVNELSKRQLLEPMEAFSDASFESEKTGRGRKNREA